MTQSLTPAPMTAMVVTNVTTGKIALHFYPIQSVAECREEFGPTLTDAKVFVEGICCTECGTEACETRFTAAFEKSCQSCGLPGCRCVLSEDPHALDVWFCQTCQPSCGCRDCTGD